MTGLGGRAVLICAAGDIHGAINRFYDDILTFEISLGSTFDWVLHVGDFGIWPDPERIDRATRNHDGAGDFSEWLNAMRPVPRRTVFIKGNHEDFEWLESRRHAEVLPGLFFLRNGCTMELKGASDGQIRVGGIGGCYGPSDYSRRSKDLQGYARRHYTHDEIDRLSSSGTLDLLLTHDAPAGIRFPQHLRREGYASEAAGLNLLLERVKPLVCFFGHHHARVDAEVAGVRCIGLNKIGRPGNLIVIEIEANRGGWSIVAEYDESRRNAMSTFI
jgi:predicted phosphodiesterase